MTDTFRVIGSGGELLFRSGEWEDRVAHARAVLAGLGAGHGDRVLAWLPRGWEEAALCEAAAGLGAVWVSVPRRTTPRQILGLVEDAEPIVAVCGAGEKSRFGQGPWIEWPDFQTMPGKETLPVVPADSDLAALCYTSGSTGGPKGVMVSHGNLRGAAQRVERYLRHAPEDRILSMMPLNAPWGLLQWRMARRAGAGIVLPPAALMAAELARTIRSAEVTGLAALPPTWVQLVDYLVSEGESLPELRYVTTSGGVVPGRILERFPEVFPNAEIWMTYGLTEAFRTTVLPPAEFAFRKGSLGKPCPDVRIEVLRADGTPAGPGESGELLHLGPCVTLGYWRRPELNEAAFKARPGHEAVVGGDAVHYSGDRVRLDEDGYLWFEGREDGLIKSGGYRISPTEIEEALEALPGVVHAVAGGVPDEALGQRIAVAVEMSASESDPVPALRTALRQVLASHQQPHVILSWPGKMPLGPNGKLDRPAILSTLRANGRNAPRPDF